MIRHLSEDVKSFLRTGVALTSFAQVVEELVLNSIDAEASNVAVRVDLESFKIQVVDNGFGIVRDQLPFLGERYATSKCKGLEDLLNLKYFGYRGEALASLRSAASFLEIVSRPRSSGITYCKCFKDGKPLDIIQSSVPRPSNGTTVTVYNLFYNLPVRRKCLKEGLEMEKIRYRLAGLAFMWPQVSFSLRDDAVGEVILQTHKCNNIATSFSTIFPMARLRNLCDVSIEQDEFKISGIVSTDSYSRKDLQFVFVNKRLILKSSLHHQINKIFGKSLILRKKGVVEDSDNLFKNGSPTKQGERYSIFAINVYCPFDCYDITFDPQKTLVEFTNWPKLIHLLQDMLYGFLRRENQLSISDFSSFINSDMNQDVESDSSCDESNFSDVESSVNVLEKFIRKAEGNKNYTNTLQTEGHKLLNSGLQSSTLTKQRSHDLFDFSTLSEDLNAADVRESTHSQKASYILETDLSCDTNNVREKIPDNIFVHAEEDDEQVLELILNGHKNNVNKQHLFVPKETLVLQKVSSEANSMRLSAPSLSRCSALQKKVFFETPFVMNQKENDTEDVLTVLSKEHKPKPIEKIALGKLSHYTSTLQKIRGNNKNSLKDTRVGTSTLQQLRTSSKKAIQCLGDMYKTPTLKVHQDNSNDCHLGDMYKTPIQNVHQDNSNDCHLGDMYKTPIQRVHQDNSSDCKIPATEIDQIEPKQALINVTSPELHEPQGSRLFKATIENRSLGQNDRKLCLKRLQNEKTTHATKLAKLMKGEKGFRKTSTLPQETSINFLQAYSFKKVRPGSPTALQKEQRSSQFEQIKESSAAVKKNHCIKASSTFMSRNMNEFETVAGNIHAIHKDERPENNELCKIRQKLLRKPSCDPQNKEPSHENIFNNSDLAVRDELNLAPKTSSDFWVDLVSSTGSLLHTTNTRLSCAVPPDTAFSTLCPPSIIAQSGESVPCRCACPAFSFSDLKQKKVHQDIMRTEKGNSRSTLPAVSSEHILIDGTSSKVTCFKKRDIKNWQNNSLIALSENNYQGTSRKTDSNMYVQNFLEQDDCNVTKQKTDQIQTKSSLCTMPAKQCEETTLKHPSKEKFLETIPSSSKTVPRQNSLQQLEFPPEKKFKTCNLFGVKCTGLENLKFYSERMKKFPLPRFDFRPSVNTQTVNKDICESTQWRDTPNYDIEHHIISHSKPDCDMLNNKERHNTAVHKIAALQTSIMSASQPFEKESNTDISNNNQLMCTESFNISHPKDNIQVSSSIEDLTGLHATHELDSNLGKFSTINSKTVSTLANVISDKVSVENDLTESTAEQQNPDSFPLQAISSNPAQFVNGSQNPDVSKMFIAVSDCAEVEASRKGTFVFNNNRTQVLTHPLSVPQKLVAFSNIQGKTISNKASTHSQGSDEEIIKLTSATQMVQSGPSICESSAQSVKKARPVKQDNNDLQIKAGQYWKELTDDYSGNKMFVNMKSGHTVSKSQWPNVPASEDQNVQDGNINGETIGQLSGSQRGCLQNIVISCMDQERAEAESKWKGGEKPIYEKNQGTNVSSIISQWNNPVFLNYKLPTLNVETCPPGQTARSCYNSQNMLEFTKDMLKNVKVVGQVDKKFIACLISTKEDSSKGANIKDGTLLVLFDQHAVHERIRLEQLTQETYETVDAVKTNQIKKSHLPDPLLMDIDQDDLRIMKTFQQEFIRIGIDFTPDSSYRNKVYINSVPCCVAEKSATDAKRLKLQSLSEKIENLISEHIEFLKSTNGTCGRLPLSLHRILCSQACHGAVKFGDQLCPRECEDLISSLALCDLPFQCAHGRPSIAPLVNLAAIDEDMVNSRPRPFKLWKISQRIGY